MAQHQAEIEPVCCFIHLPYLYGSIIRLPTKLTFHMKRKLGFLDRPRTTAFKYQTGGAQEWTRLCVHPSICVDRLAEVRITNLAVVVDCSMSIYPHLEVIKELITGLASVLSASLLEPTDVNVVFVITGEEEALVLNDGLFQSADKIDTHKILKHLTPSSLHSLTCHSGGMEAAMNALNEKKTKNATSVVLAISAFSPSTHVKDHKENLATHVDACCARHPTAVFALVCGQTPEVDYSLVDSIVGRRGCYAVVTNPSIQTDAVELFQKFSASLGCSRTTIIVTKSPPEVVATDDDENVDVNTPTREKKRARRESAAEKHHFVYDVGLLTPLSAALGRSFLIDVPCDETSEIETVFSSSASNTISSSRASIQDSVTSEEGEDLDIWWKSKLLSIRNTCNIGLDVFARVVNDIHEVPDDKTYTNGIKVYALKRLLDLMVTRSAVHSRRDLLDVARRDQARRRHEEEEQAAMANSQFGWELFPSGELPKDSLPGYGCRSCRVEDTNTVLCIRNALTCMSLCSV